MRTAYDNWLALHRAPGTRTLYNNRLDKVLNGTPIKEVTLEKMEKYLADQKDHYAASTLNGDMVILNTFLNWLVRRGDLEKNSLKGLERLTNNDDPGGRALDEKEIRALIGTPRGLLWEFFISTGVRKGEFIALERGDVAGAVTVRPSTAKRRRGRVIPLLDGMKAKLKRYFGSRETGPAFVNGQGRRWKNNLLRALQGDVRRAGINEDGVHLHSLRKTFCTRLIYRGADPRTVQHLMGHASIDTTMGVYSAYVAETSEETLKAMEMP